MIKLYYFLLIFTIVSCKDHETKVSNPKGLAVSGSYEVVPDYVGGYKLPEEKINTVYDRYSFTLKLNQNEPESALMLDFLTKGRRIY